MSDFFKKASEEYFNLQASDGLTKKVGELLKQSHRAVWKRITLIAASLVVLCLVTLQFSPNLVSAASKVPVLGGIVQVLTFNRFEVKDDGYTAQVDTPQVSGLMNKELQDELNRQFKQNASAMINAFNSDQKLLKSLYPDQTVHYGIKASYEVKTNSQDYLSLEWYVASTSNGNTDVSFYTIDKRTNQLVTLKGLFKKNADYVSVISPYIRQQMLYQNQHENGLYFVDTGADTDFKSIASDNDFYMNSDGNIVICFQKYEVAAGAQGEPEFVIPKNVVQNILN